MHAEIVAIGTEITNGAKLDTNSQWISLALAELGIPTHFHSSVADELEEITGVLRDAVNRSDLVFITGGLGPTLDDLTRQALAALVQRELILNDDAMAHIESLFARRNRPMPERNRMQAMFPEGSEVIPNPRGTAPGIWMEVSRKGKTEPCRIAALPGVPSEMKRMFEAEVRPRLPFGGRVIRRARVNCFGIGESDAEELLGELTARGNDPDIGITVHEATITLRISAHGDTAAACDEKIAAAKKEIRRRMRHFVFGEEDEELEHVVVRMLHERGKTLATAESGTGGLLSFRLSETDTFHDVYCGGLVAVNERELHRLVEAEQQPTSAENSDRAELALRIARLTRTKFQSDFALAVVDCPVFDPDSRDKGAAATYVALANASEGTANEVTLFGDPAIQKSRTVKAALNQLRLEMLRHTG